MVVMECPCFVNVWRPRLRSLDQDIYYSLVTRFALHAHDTWPCTRIKSESKSRNRVSARAKLEVFYVFYAYFILKQKTVKYGVFYYFSAVSFNYGKMSQ